MWLHSYLPWVYSKTEGCSCWFFSLHYSHGLSGRTSTMSKWMYWEDAVFTFTRTYVHMCVHCFYWTPNGHFVFFALWFWLAFIPHVLSGQMFGLDPRCAEHAEKLNLQFYMFSWLTFDAYSTLVFTDGVFVHTYLVPCVWAICVYKGPVRLYLSYLF